MTVRIVRLSEVRIDGGTQFRDQINQDLVKLYAEKMQEGAVFPPIKATFDGTDYWLYDGFHRYFSIHDLGQKEISVDYVPGTREDAQDLALSANDDHGLQRNNATKRKCVESALEMERHAKKSNREIAKLCKVSDTFVASIRNPEAKKKQAEKVERHYKKKTARADRRVRFNRTPAFGTQALFARWQRAKRRGAGGQRACHAGRH